MTSPIVTHRLYDRDDLNVGIISQLTIKRQLMWVWECGRCEVSGQDRLFEFALIAIQTHLKKHKGSKP